MPARASRQPIYLSISDESKGVFSGRYNFHSLKNQAAVFIRDGGKISGLEDLHPYYLLYKQKWFVTASENFEQGEGGGFLKSNSTGLSTSIPGRIYLLLTLNCRIRY